MHDGKKGKIQEFLPFYGGAELQYERILRFGRHAVALGLVIETEIYRIGRRKGVRLGRHDRVQADASRGKVFCDEGVADGVVINAPVLVQHVQGGSVAVGRTKREAVVDQGVAVGPFG